MKVAIIQKYVPQYRRHFFDLLSERLSQMEIELSLIYGQAGPVDSKKEDAVNFEWGKYVQSRIFTLREREFYWQPILGFIKDADLVIVEQANKLLINNLLILQNMIGIRKLAYWGHGRNFQAMSSNQVSESLKSFLANKVHWWFAYNQLSASIVRESGYPDERITVVQNAIDTHQLSKALLALSDISLSGIRSELGLRSQNVAIYAGGMYREKCLPFLLQSLQLIRRRVPDFEMILIGSGVDVGLIRQAAAENPWIHYLGPMFGAEKVPYFALSKLFLMPGLVGLSILDAFALETPLITTSVPFHSPEIDYLKNGINGIMVSDTDNPQVYANEVVALLSDEDRRQHLIKGCRTARDCYTIEEMVENFSRGIEKALKE